MSGKAKECVWISHEFRESPKFKGLSPAALGLWADFVMKSSQNNPQGTLASISDLLENSSRDTPEAIQGWLAELVERGLVAPTGTGGYLLSDLSHVRFTDPYAEAQP